MTFVSGFLYGSGLSLGICVGLVAWVFLRTAVNKVLGIADQLDTLQAFNRKNLDALEERNRLTVGTNELVERISRDALRIASRIDENR